MVNFVRTTRRWYDRGTPRDAGESDACQIIACSAPTPLHFYVGAFFYAQMIMACILFEDMRLFHALHIGIHDDRQT